MVRLSFIPGTDSGQTLLEEQEREISKASSSSASSPPLPNSQLLSTNNNATVQVCLCLFQSIFSLYSV